MVKANRRVDLAPVLNLAHYPHAQFLTVEEVAPLLRQRPRTIYKWVAACRIPHYKPSRTLLFVEAEIDAWVESHRRGAE